ncbi:MAG: DNA alkylation repair protein [Bacteroidota bacterium]|nr:DNA alkylation repair protein [Bacteroidota bacterium]
MRNQFPYYGIPSPLRKTIAKKLIQTTKPFDKNELIYLVTQCWAEPEREMVYIALDYSFKFQKKLDEGDIPFYDHLIENKSWWDTVDGLAPHIIGLIAIKNPVLTQNVAWKFISSNNFWYQRSALILQLFYKEKTNFDLMGALILERCSSKEFFVQKAMGWALRQYSKTNPEAVTNFIETHKKRLPPLAIREGNKIILKKDKI